MPLFNVSFLETCSIEYFPDARTHGRVFHVMFFFGRGCVQDDEGALPELSLPVLVTFLEVYFVLDAVLWCRPFRNNHHPAKGDHVFVLHHLPDRLDYPLNHSVSANSVV